MIEIIIKQNIMEVYVSELEDRVSNNKLQETDILLNITEEKWKEIMKSDYIDIKGKILKILNK